MDDIYKNIEKRNPNKRRKILIVFDDMMTDMLSDKKLNSIINEAFITGRKLNISLVFISQSYLALPRNIRLNSMHYFLMKIPNKQELQQIAFNHSSDIDFQGLTWIYIQNVLQNHNLFWLLILLLRQIILYESERIF